MPPLSFTEQENVCKQIFDDAVYRYGPFWHLCTPGENQQVIFISKEFYEFGMLLMAMCAFDCPNVRIITFELMANHIHIVLCGAKTDCEDLFELYKKRLSQYLRLQHSGIDLTNFIGTLHPIDSLESLRTRIAYTNRNNYVVDHNQTPWSFPYGANSFYFSEIHKAQENCRLGKLSVRSKRAMMHQHNCNYPDDAIVIGNYISPMSFCDIRLGESMFRNARHYFNKISRGIESYNDVARESGDSIFYTYDELFSAVYGICNQKYSGQKPNLLGKNDKLDLAKKLHYEYNADNRSISKILCLEIGLVNSLFPSPPANINLHFENFHS